MPIGKDVKGYYVRRKIYNKDTGKWEDYDGQEGHAGLKTVYKYVTNTSTTILTVTTGKAGYVTYLAIHNERAAAQDIELVDTSGKVLKRNYASDEWSETTKEKPFIFLNQGAVSGVAETGSGFHVTMSYYERTFKYS